MVAYRSQSLSYYLLLGCNVCQRYTWTLPFLSKTTNCRLTNSSFRPSLDKNKTYKLVFSFDYNVTVNHEIPILPVNHIGQFQTL